MTVLLKPSFEDAPLGPYSPSRLSRDFGDPVFFEGLERVSVVAAAGSPSGKALRVCFPQGAVGPRLGGAQWRVPLPSAHVELFAGYALCFEPGFEFVKGGKLPGLVGGSANTGGERPSGRDGFSARMMWRAAGQAVQYVYHPDQPSRWGQDFPYVLQDAVHFEPGRWYQVQHRVKLNRPGVQPPNGLIQAWLDGQPCLDQPGLRFRDTVTLAVDQFYFSTFFGGDEADWAPVKDEFILFDAFWVATQPLVDAL